MGKYCIQCGTMMNDDDKFCPKCGASNEGGNNNFGQQQNVNVESQNNYSYNNPTNNVQPNYNNQVNYNAQPNYNNQENNTVNSTKMSSLAISSFVCSLIGIVIATLPLGFTAIASAIGSFNRKKYFPNETGNGFAVAGLIIGVIEVILMIYLISIGRSAFSSNFF